MCRILLTIPIPFLGREISIYGFGVMLALAMLICTTLAAKRYKSVGGDPEKMYDLALWFLFGGVIGGRVFYFIQYREHFQSIWDLFKIWEGGMVFYGSAIGAMLGFAVFILRTKLKPFQMLDCIAPAIALGLAFGRIGCFLNGCCYGDLSTMPWSVSYPFGADAGNKMMSVGLQSTFGFYPSTERIRGDGLVVNWVEPGVDAERAGLKPGDVIVGINGVRGESAQGVRDLLMDFLKSIDARKRAPPLGLMLLEGDKVREVTFRLPESLPVHPTQLYSSIGAFLLYLLLSAAFPFRTRDGQILAILLVSYPVGRFLIEFLRFDEKPLWDGLTISQNISIPVFIIGIIASIYFRRPANPPAVAPAS